LSLLINLERFILKKWLFISYYACKWKKLFFKFFINFVHSPRIYFSKKLTFVIPIIKFSLSLSLTLFHINNLQIDNIEKIEKYFFKNRCYILFLLRNQIFSIVTNAASGHVGDFRKIRCPFFNFFHPLSQWIFFYSKK
jgi:hypothetical protein